ncbi:hypothetical protein B0H66DRAFT_552685 [Apodospora peruviana]|uniref:Zn(2)-C6 fungal-type domain-containing protein n=1 Tax=Apodospora peruviana TaxID=516989 RepID=A0AAE0IBA0_9PEZI|nr:hypothetical protein B0H66DRAFT_552685 [Apodospora peruviana]
MSSKLGIPIRNTRSTRPAQKRERSAHNKTRTGCKTCKIRRIKCDEARPACLRCSSTRRTCDGYDEPNDEKRWVVITGPSLSLSLPVALNSFPESLEDEPSRTSFDFFRTASVPELSRFFGRSFWSQSLLSTSHQFPAVMSAVLALASLHRRFKNGEPLIQGDLFTARQYDKALKQLIRAISGTTAKAHCRLMSLLCGVLFTVIEVLQGCNQHALAHLDSIIKLLNEIPRTTTATGEEVLVTTDTVMQDLKDVILRFDVEGAIFSPRRSPGLALPPLPPRRDQEVLSAVIQPPGLPDNPQAVSLDQAADELNHLMAHMSQFIYTTKPYRHETAGNVPLSMLLEQQDLVAHFQRWWDRANTSLDLTNIKTVIPKNPEHRMRVALLRLHYHASWTMLQCCLHAEETAYDRYLESFRDIVRCARAAVLEDGGSYHPLSTKPAAAPPGSGSFSTDMGVVFPLYWTALRCRDGRLRREALALLRIYGAREGVWVPEIQTRVAARVIELEEGLDAGSLLPVLPGTMVQGEVVAPPSSTPLRMEDVYEFRRCHSVIHFTDRVGRKVRMVYQRRLNGLDGEWDVGTEWLSY